MLEYGRSYGAAAQERSKLHCHDMRQGQKGHQTLCEGTL